MVGNVEHIGSPRIVQSLSTVEYPAQVGHAAPRRVCGIAQADLEIVAVQPDLKGKRQPGFRTCRIVAPYPQSNHAAQAFLAVAWRKLRIIDGEGVVVLVDEARQFDGRVLAAGAERFLGCFKFNPEHGGSLVKVGGVSDALLAVCAQLQPSARSAQAGTAPACAVLHRSPMRIPVSRQWPQLCQSPAVPTSISCNRRHSHRNPDRPEPASGQSRF